MLGYDDGYVAGVIEWVRLTSATITAPLNEVTVIVHPGNMPSDLAATTGMRMPPSTF